MPPKRGRSAAGGGTSSTAAAAKERPSKLAKEHNITAGEEAEIKEAFGLFAEPMDGEKEGVIPIGDVRRAMVALNLAPSSKAELAEFVSILDPDDEGYANYEPFVAICALKLHARSDEDDEYDDGGGSGSGAAGRGGRGAGKRERHAAEVDEAFRLFTSAAGAAGGGEAGPTLTLGHLKRVAMALKQDVDEALLKDMILEANGGAGVGKGVSRAEFDEVMRRAGAWK